MAWKMTKPVQVREKKIYQYDLIEGEIKIKQKICFATSVKTGEWIFDMSESEAEGGNSELLDSMTTTESEFVTNTLKQLNKVKKNG